MKVSPGVAGGTDHRGFEVLLLCKQQSRSAQDCISSTSSLHKIFCSHTTHTVWHFLRGLLLLLSEYIFCLIAGTQKSVQRAGRTHNRSIWDVNSQTQDSSVAYLTPSSCLLTMSRQAINASNTELGAVASTHFFNGMGLKGVSQHAVPYMHPTRAGEKLEAGNWSASSISAAHSRVVLCSDLVLVCKLRWHWLRACL